MTNEEKHLLVKDICARLPYGLKVKCEKYSRPVTVLYAGKIDEVKFEETGGIEHICAIKPYLRPLSSITEEEKEEASEAIEIELNALQGPGGFTVENASSYTFMIDFYNKHHLDYRGLIEKGLALEAPKDMYCIKTE